MYNISYNLFYSFVYTVYSVHTSKAHQAWSHYQFYQWHTSLVSALMMFSRVLSSDLFYIQLITEFSRLHNSPPKEGRRQGHASTSLHTGQWSRLTAQGSNLHPINGGGMPTRAPCRMMWLHISPSTGLLLNGTIDLNVNLLVPCTKDPSLNPSSCAFSEHTINHVIK